MVFWEVRRDACDGCDFVVAVCGGMLVVWTAHYMATYKCMTHICALGEWIIVQVNFLGWRRYAGWGGRSRFDTLVLLRVHFVCTLQVA